MPGDRFDARLIVGHPRAQRGFLLLLGRDLAAQAVDLLALFAQPLAARLLVRRHGARRAGLAAGSRPAGGLGRGLLLELADLALGALDVGVLGLEAQFELRQVGARLGEPLRRGAARERVRVGALAGRRRGRRRRDVLEILRRALVQPLEHGLAIAIAQRCCRPGSGAPSAWTARPAGCHRADWAGGRRSAAGTTRASDPVRRSRRSASASWLWRNWLVWSAGRLAHPRVLVDQLSPSAAASPSSRPRVSG